MAAPMIRLVAPKILLKIASSTQPSAYKMFSTATPLNMVRAVRRSRVSSEAKTEENGESRPTQIKPAPTSPRTRSAVSQSDMLEVEEKVFMQANKMSKIHDVEDTMESEASPSHEKFKYEKAGRDDKRLGRLMMMVKSRKYREQKGWIMLEGRRLITDAIDAGLQPHTIFFSRVENLEDIPVQETSATLVKAPFKDIAMWSDLVTTQGVIGVFRKPTHQDMHPSHSSALPLTLICDNVREPGNLGTILRSAVAARCQKIILTKGCVDLWEPKVLRSGAGAHFYMPILTNVSWKEVPNHLDENVVVHVADNNVLRDDMPKTDSRMDLLTKQDIANSNRHVNQDQVFIESKLYHHVNWKAKSALVIGGETEGLRDSALALCNKTLGYRVHIPMATAMDSLNSAVSASVILFEALRQHFVVDEN